MTIEHEEAVRLAEKFGTSTVGLYGAEEFAYQRWSFDAGLLAALIAEVRREAMEEDAALCESKSANGNWAFDTRHDCAEAIRAKLEEGE